jgi:CDP-4-dehydro-6-deoxyglucose reductase
MLERVVQIRDEAFGRRLRERLLPSQEVLAQRLFRQSQELADVQRHLQRYHALVLELRGACCAASLPQDERPRLLALQRQLNDGLARALATESVDVLDVMDDMLKVVSAQVTLRPSGHQFAVEGHDTLLQAGMRAGLKLNYGCGNGSCGMCKVRVTDGQVARTHAHRLPAVRGRRRRRATCWPAPTPPPAAS